jgi:hypothetical protein
MSRRHRVWQVSPDRAAHSLFNLFLLFVREGDARLSYIIAVSQGLLSGAACRPAASSGFVRALVLSNIGLKRTNGPIAPMMSIMISAPNVNWRAMLPGKLFHIDVLGLNLFRMD